MPKHDVLLLAFFVFFALVLFAALVQMLRVFWQDRKFAGRPDCYGRRVKAAWGPIRKDGLCGRPAIQPPFDHAGCERTYIDLAKETP